MDNREIKRILHALPGFLGVFSRDTLPFITNPDKFVRSFCRNKNSSHVSLIVNTDYLRRRGKHWIAILVSKNGRFAYYFDSLGGIPQTAEIFNFCAQFETCYYNKTGHSLEKFSGAYACWVVWKMMEKVTFKKIVFQFEKLVDDQFVTDWINRDDKLSLN